jgi:CubicO group peptidase (beta-lactamase class C family)
MPIFFDIPLSFCYNVLVALHILPLIIMAPIMKHLSIIIIITILLLSSQKQQTYQPSISENGKTTIDQLLQGAVDRNEIPGVVAIVANKDEIMYHNSFGKLDVANNIDMPNDAIFNIASMTKPITSVAIMMLHEEGRLALDDPISKFIPSLNSLEVITHFNETDTTYTTTPAKNKITIRHLLSHTSGFGYGFSNHILRLLQNKTGKGPRELPLLHEPGSRWTYGMGTRILGELVEEITGKPLFHFLKAKIFDQLGMDDTFYVVPEQKYSRLVTIHQRQNGALIEEPKPQVKKQRTFIAGDGGLKSTADDYIAFLQMFLNKGTLFNKRILNEESINLMIQNQIDELVVEEQTGNNPRLSMGFPLGAGSDKFGFGFQITVSTIENRNFRSPGSYSWAGIFNTHFWVDPKRDIAAVILMQVSPFYDEACIRVYQGFEELIYKHLD